jgi:hypothetical protein
MFRFRPGARTLGVSTALAFVGAAACGGAQDTPFYDSPATIGSASSGALTSSGGAVASGGATNGGAPIAGTTSVGAGGVTPLGGANGTGATTGAGAGGNGTGGYGGDVNSVGGAGNVGGVGASDGEPGGASNDAGAPDGQAGAPSEPPVDCTPHGARAVAFDGHCYEFHADVATFADAKSACADDGAHLVTISSEGRSVAQFLAENSFVWQLAGQSETWLGATDGKGPHAQGDGTYYAWITGEPMTFDNWSSGQPNNARSSCQDNVPCSCNQGACYEHCGFQWDTPGRQMDALPGWNDRLCDHVLTYVCEWDG